MLDKLSLKQMIFAGFGLVLTLLIVLSALSLRGTWSIGGDFTDYRQSARESLLVNEAMQELLSVRLAVMQYRINNSDSYANRVRQHVSTLRSVKDELSGFVVDDAQVAQISEVSSLIDGYEAGFERVYSIQTQRNDLVPMLNGSGRDARSKLSDIIDSAYGDGDIEAAYYGGIVQQHLMLARYYGEKFLLANQDDDRDRTLQEIDIALENYATLDRNLQNPRRRAMAAEFEEHFAQFADLFSQIVSLVEERNGVLASELDTFGPQMAQAYAAVLENVVDKQNTVGPRAAERVASVGQSTMVISVVAVLLGAVAAFFIGRLIARSISDAVARMSELADGQLDIEITGDDRKDELGDMARALLIFRDKGRENERLQAEQAAAEERAEVEKRQALNALADEFEGNVNEVVSSVSNAAQLMVNLSSTLSESAGRAGERSTTVAAASEEASTNVETVAAASEQMTNSIAEVSERITQSASMTEDAARGTEKATNNVSKLSQSAQTIGDVIAMISAIAEQTNLLALNATIEAARAGEAGKGFAVVASEVKSLANQTAKATEEISSQITGMQTDTGAVVEAIENIGTMIQELNAGASSIAAAVEEQHSATQEIARNTQQAADGTREVSANISEVSTAVQETGSAAGEVLTASSQLAEEAERLRDSVSNFLQSIRAA
ncbi:MAG: HAMP domain-containing methyl-accepting chemotaxis protein [Pseudomonadota bacterium]